MIKEIIIKVDSEESKYKVLSKVHDQLKGNQDYIDSNIVLNDDDHGTGEHLVTVYITKEAKDVPKIIL